MANPIEDTTPGKMFDNPDFMVNRRRTVPIMKPQVLQPVTVMSPGSCSCGQGSGFEQKIKENPVLFLIGALLVGYLLARN